MAQRIISVEPASPAARAGIRAGDELIRIGVITHRDYRPTKLGQMYLDILHRVVGGLKGD